MHSGLAFPAGFSNCREVSCEFDVALTAESRTTPGPHSEAKLGTCYNMLRHVRLDTGSVFKRLRAVDNVSSWTRWQNP